MGRTRILGAIAMLVAVIATGGRADADPGVVGYPAVMAATGDSITKALAAGPWVETDNPARSWATGTEVTSHYARILATLPTASRWTDAQIGAHMSDLAWQMTTVNAQHAGYVTVLMGGNDVCQSNEALMTPVADFLAQFRSAMDTLAAGSPTARVFVASVPDPYRLWEVLHTDANAVSMWTTYSECQSMLANPTSLDQVDVDRRARVRQRVIDYNAQLSTICAEYIHCRFDGNAVFNTPFGPADISTMDYFHPSMQGQQRIADVTWAVTFDFTDAIAPTTTATTSPDPTGFLLTLTATDNAGIAGIEHRLDGARWQRYTGAVSVAFGHVLDFRAVDVNGNTEASQALAPVVAPPTLGGATTRAAGAVDLTWTASPTSSTHTVSYDVMRRVPGGAFVVVGSTSGLAYADTPPADGSYEYAVRSAVVGATSAPSNVVAATSDRTPPTSTASSAPAPGGIAVALSATDGGGVGAIEVAIDQGAFATYTGPVTVAFDHTLAYRAVDVYGNVEPTRSLTSVVEPATLGSATSVAAGGVSLSWSASSSATANAVSYVVLRRAPGGAFAAVASVAALQLVDTPPADATYEYAVQASVGSSTSAASNALSAVSDRTAPTPSQLSAATGVFSGEVSLSWTASADAGTGVSGYAVRWVQANSCPAPSAAAYPGSMATGKATATTISGLTNGKRYCFYVTASDVAGNLSAPSNIANARAR